MSGFTRNYTWIETDSIGNRNISGKWFFDRDSEWNIKQELSSEVKDKLIYGVAFELHEDSCKTDQEIVAEIQEMYPGNYTYTVEWGYKYYVWERDCLTIFVKRIYDDPEGNSIPEVSFCYGISSSEASTYGKYTGYINGFPD
ncbi:hypothetical protein [Dyadobacter sandarakinus]|uniref:Uncharacterized protein n=1 Tax=Dyadobacter sandarakinus TaxID=2747268 RepID=A0ABX7I9F5_9BACT|nr:hypothetical protein [Dyadobacter sandarakinus]QRR02615.1 hypothetical protein HWI92_17700 [Dyadobacter sandarakinus]